MPLLAGIGTAAAILVLLVALFVFLLKPGRPGAQQQKPFMGLNVAHRGLHTGNASVPENSLPAFEKACEAGYGIELDLQLSKDGYVVVFHDDTLTRICGVDARVDSKTLAELQELRLLESSESPPLFSDVLALVNGRVPLIVELKMSRQNALLCQKTLALLQDYAGDYCIESFDPRIVGWFKTNAPSILRGQLSSPPNKLGNGILGVLVGNLLSNFLARPQFIAYDIAGKPLLARLGSRGAMKVAWTVRPNNTIAEIEKQNDAVIFELYTPPTHFK